MKKLIVFLILFAMTVVCRAANEIHTNYPSAETEGLLRRLSW